MSSILIGISFLAFKTIVHRPSVPSSADSIAPRAANATLARLRTPFLTAEDTRVLHTAEHRCTPSRCAVSCSVHSFSARCVHITLAQDLKRCQGTENDNGGSKTSAAGGNFGVCLLSPNPNPTFQSIRGRARHHRGSLPKCDRHHTSRLTAPHRLEL